MNPFFRLMVFIYAIRSFIDRKVFFKHIGDRDLVLDIGSGDKPFWRADVLVDLYPDDDQQRFSGAMLYDKRKIFVNADVEKLPFKDKVFDFVVCSHLLEHVEHPDKAIKEITRVGKRGYIEVPRAVLDALAPFPPHLWFCEIEGNTLVFKRKGTRQNFFLSSIKRFGDAEFYTAIMQYILVKDYDVSFVRFYWNNSMSFRIEKPEGKPYMYTYKPERKHVKTPIVSVSHKVYKLFYLVMNALYYKEKNINRRSLFK